MRVLSRSLAVAAVAGAVFTATPAQASSTDILGYVCGPDSRSASSQCDLFWLFRPCGPLVACP